MSDQNLDNMDDYSDLLPDDFKQDESPSKEFKDYDLDKLSKGKPFSMDEIENLFEDEMEALETSSVNNIDDDIKIISDMSEVEDLSNIIEHNSELEIENEDIIDISNIMDNLDFEESNKNLDDEQTFSSMFDSNDDVKDSSVDDISDVFAESLSAINELKDVEDIDKEPEKVVLPKKKLSLFQRIKEYLMAPEDEADEIDAREEEKYKEKKSKKKAEKDAKKAEKAEAKKIKAEEKKKALEEKKKIKEEQKKQKAKEKEEKRKKKAEQDALENYYVVNKRNFFSVIGIVVLITIISSFFIFSSMYIYNVNNANKLYKARNYTSAYNEIKGIAILENDRLLRDKLETIMKVNRYIDSYSVFSAAGDEYRSVNSLFGGIRSYNENLDEAKNIGVEKEYHFLYGNIVDILENKFLVSKNKIDYISKLEDNVKYTKEINKIVKK